MIRRIEREKTVSVEFGLDKSEGSLAYLFNKRSFFKVRRDGGSGGAIRRQVCIMPKQIPSGHCSRWAGQVIEWASLSRAEDLPG